MTTFHFTKLSTAQPEDFVSALTDFGPGRSELFPRSLDECLVVHEIGLHFAEVTEGDHACWERLRYDWSDPARIVMTTVDSNVWGGGSGHTWTLMPLSGGLTLVDVVIVREGRNRRGRAIALMLETVGWRGLEFALSDTLKTVERRCQRSTMPRTA